MASTTTAKYIFLFQIVFCYKIYTSVSKIATLKNEFNVIKPVS